MTRGRTPGTAANHLNAAEVTHAGVAYNSQSLYISLYLYIKLDLFNYNLSSRNIINC